MFGRIPQRLVVSVWLAAQASASAVAADDLYEWLATAPVVLTARSLGDDGKYTDVVVEEVLRGEPASGRVRVNVTRANRDRDREIYPRALHLTEGTSYLLLLTPAGTSEGRPAYELTRGVRGSRELPAEGLPAYLSAVRRFLAIQDLKQDSLIWDGLRELLDGTHPLMIETSLDQHLKFRRGEAELVLTVRPLLRHPAPDLRERAARLTGQIAGRLGREALPEPEALQDELTALARRDPVARVRAAGTEALDELDGPGVLEVLREISEDDPDQVVRLAAERFVRERTTR